jgi:hypothetical protein
MVGCVCVCVRVAEGEQTHHEVLLGQGEGDAPERSEVDGCHGASASHRFSHLAGDLRVRLSRCSTTTLVSMNAAGASGDGEEGEVVSYRAG